MSALHESVNSASVLTKGNWHNQKDYPRQHHLGQGKDVHELYMQMTEGYIRGTSTMHVRVTTKGQEVIVVPIGDNYYLPF